MTVTLTVRLQPELELALELHCAERGVAISLVVQEMLAEYLARAQPAWPSANCPCFEALWLIGAGDLGGRSADQARVREVIAQRMASRSAIRKR
jgi:hypothetical protein